MNFLSLPNHKFSFFTGQNVSLFFDINDITDNTAHKIKSNKQVLKTQQNNLNCIPISTKTSTRFQATNKFEATNNLPLITSAAYLSGSDFEMKLSKSFARKLSLDKSNLALYTTHQAFKMLRSCQYHIDDLLRCAALTICHWPKVQRKIFKCFPNDQNDSFSHIKEIVYISILQLFLSHCWLLDQTCPLKEWHRHIFSSYCSFSCLNEALMKLFLLQEYKLSFDSKTVESVALQLISTSSEFTNLPNI